MCSSYPWATDPDSCVLVINTGGTFGMKKTSGAYKPGKNNDELTDFLKCSQIFGTWRGDRFVIDQINADSSTPPVSYKVQSLKKLLDSSNMTPAGWNEIAKTVEENYRQYKGFVVIHGTDTMVFSASILSFMFENLGKPVVITGAQIPIFEARSDARDNLINSVITASTCKIPEVLLCFGNNVFRGNRCVKKDSSGFDAFISPNHPPLIELGVGMKKNLHALGKVVGGQQNLFSRLKVRTMPKDCKVGILRLYPGINEKTVKRILEEKAGVVLQSFGAGNAPDEAWFKTALTNFTNSRGIVINVTQCHEGTVTSDYACGEMLEGCGVLAGGDMTEEAAYCKLCYMLARDDIGELQWFVDMENPIRKEMTTPKSPQKKKQMAPYC